FIETMDAQYVVAARGRGVPELRLIRSHALRPALLPLVTMVGLDLGGALMAVIYIDSIYGLSGIGTLLLNGIADRVTGTYDLPLIAAVWSTPAPPEPTRPPSTRWAGVATTCTEASLRILYLYEAVAEACLPLADLRATTLAWALWPEPPHAQSARTQAPSVPARRRA